MKAILSIYLLLLFSFSFQTEPGNYNITIVIDGVKNSRGFIIVNLYNKSGGFPVDGSKAIQSIKVTPTVPFCKVIFKSIHQGVYAVSVMHDENNNGLMDKNFFGIPTEGYCVSNNAKGFMSAPSFSNAKFEVNSNVKQVLKMIY